MRERAEASLGRERIRLQTLFHCFETHVADANHTAGSLSRMFCNTSPFISSNHGVVRCVLVLLILNVDDDDDDEENEEVSASAIVVEIEKTKNQKKTKRQYALAYSSRLHLLCNNTVQPRGFFYYYYYFFIFLYINIIV